MGLNLSVTDTNDGLHVTGTIEDICSCASSLGSAEIIVGVTELDCKFSGRNNVYFEGSYFAMDYISVQLRRSDETIYWQDEYYPYSRRIQSNKANSTYSTYGTAPGSGGTVSINLDSNQTTTCTHWQDVGGVRQLVRDKVIKCQQGDPDDLPVKIYVTYHTSISSTSVSWPRYTYTQSLTDVCMYVMPQLSGLSVWRSDSSGTASTQGLFGAYGVTHNGYSVALAAQDYPAFLANSVAMTVTFTRVIDGVDTPYTLALKTGSADGYYSEVLKQNNTAIQLGNEETFNITVTIEDALNTVSLTEMLSANFAIFNANAAKTGIAFGKYATQSGFDCNMEAEFRGSSVFDADAEDSIHHTFNSIPFIVPNMMECLWRKASPTASMGGNSTFTLSRDLTAGEPVLLVYRMWDQTDAFSNIQTVVGWAGHAVRLFCLATSTTNRNGTRPITIGPRGSYNAKTVYYGNCEYNGSTNNNYCVLLAVYAFKREWLNHDDALSEYETANNL